MALSGRPFREIYAELVAREPTWTERFNNLFREEVGARKDIRVEEGVHFKDVLHIAAVLIAEKKMRESGSPAPSERQAALVKQQQGPVWTPAAPPRMPRGCKAGFPKAKFHDLCEEEAELRRWLHGVEGRLREHIEHACQESNYIMNRCEVLFAHECRGRTRLETEEDAAFKAIKQRMFRAAPPDFFRMQVVKRFGATERPATPLPPELGVEEQESYARAQLNQQEQAGRHEAHQYLVDRYNQCLFGLNHREVVEREETERQEVEALYPLVTSRCRKDFGLCYYHTPAVFLHLRLAHGEHSVMAQMCTWHLARIRGNAEQVRRGLYAVGAEAATDRPAPPAHPAEAASPLTPPEEAVLQEGEQPQPQSPPPHIASDGTPAMKTENDVVCLAESTGNAAMTAGGVVPPPPPPPATAAPGGGDATLIASQYPDRTNRTRAHTHRQPEG